MLGNVKKHPPSPHITFLFETSTPQKAATKERLEVLCWMQSVRKKLEPQENQDFCLVQGRDMVVSEWERRPPDQAGSLERQLTSSVCTFLPRGGEE